MRKLYALLLFAVALGMIACGGGGGGGGNGSNGGGTPTYSHIRIEAVPAGNTNRPIDPTHILVGEQVIFQLVGYDQNGVRTILSEGPFTSSDVADQSGDLTAAGVLTATAPSNDPYTVSVNALGQTYTTTYRVQPVRAIVSGQVRNTYSVTADAVDVVFVDADGNVLARVRTAYDGFFRASVPTSATRFNLDPASLPTQLYFRSFVYADLRYTALDTACSAPLPTLADGVVSELGLVRIDASVTPGGSLNTPPPPPDGCF